MNLLNKLTIENLRLNKKRSVVTIIGIMLSVALITAVSTMYSSAINTLITFEKEEKGNFHVAYYNVPITEINTIRNNSKIDKIFISQDIGYAALKESKNELKPYIFVKAFTKDSLENLSLNLTEGRMPTNENEIIIPTHLKTNGRVELKVGDTIELNIGKRVSDGYELNQNNNFNITQNEEIINTENKKYTIVGITERPDTNIEPYSAPGYTFITFINENQFINSEADLYVKYSKDGLKNYEDITANILEIDTEAFLKYCKGDFENDEEFNKVVEEINKAKYDINVNEYLITLETNPINEGSVKGLGVVVGIVCVIIIITSVFCIKNSFDISITEKIRQYGMLRSIGATKKQIKRNVFFEATILGLIGIPLGILFGFLASYILIIVTNYFLTDMINTTNEDIRLVMSFSWMAVGISIILGVITIYLSAIKSARKASKISPIEAIRNSGNIQIKNKKLKCPKLITKLFGVGGKISYKNVKRNKKKYRTTVISIIVSVFVFIALSSFMELAFKTIDSEVKFSNYDVHLVLENEDYNKNYEYANKTIELDNISDYSIQRYSTGFIKNANYDGQYVDYIKETREDYEQKAFLNGNLIIVSIGDYQYKKYINELNLKLDDIEKSGILIDEKKLSMSESNKNEITKKSGRYFSYNKNDVLNIDLRNSSDDVFIKSFEIKIGAVTDKVPFGLEAIVSDSPVLIISDKKFDENLKETINQVQVKYKSENASQLQDDIEKVVKDQEYSLNNISENANMMRNFYILMAIFLYGFIIVISLIGITNIFNTITTNMELRKQEFASLKSIGMTKKEFNQMISLESIFIGAKSLIFGIPIGTLLSYLIYHYLAEGSGIKYSLPIIAIIISIFVVFCLIGIIMRYSINKINKQNTIETIRNENI